MEGRLGEYQTARFDEELREAAQAPGLLLPGLITLSCCQNLSWICD